MLFESPAVEALVTALRKLPGVGKRSAERLALHLLSAPEEDALSLSHAIQDARERVSRCTVCGNLTEANPCGICSDDRRHDEILCVVEQPAAVMAIEKGGSFRGRYHVLYGVLNPLDGIGPSELNLDSLMRRLEEGTIREVVIATNTTAEGEATALYLARRFGQMDIAATRIAHGVPMGGGLEYADDATLQHAFEGRLPLR